MKAVYHLMQRPLIVMKQIRIVRIELTTKDWKSPILPLNYIRMRVHRIGLEPITPSSVAKCSIQLSYPCICSGITLPLLRG